MNKIYLVAAVVGEVVGTSALKVSDGFSRLIPSLIVLGGYTVAFFFLSLTLRTLPVGIVYAMWSGVGIVLISLIAYFVFHQSLDLPAIVGMALIVTGVVVVNVFSHSVPH